MNSLSYILILIIISICLLISTKEKYGGAPLPELLPAAPSNLRIDESTRTNNLIKIKWGSPQSPQNDPIKGYLIMLKKVSDTLGNGMYINFKLNGLSCINKCNYILNNLNLAPNTNYILGIMAFNNQGTGPTTSINFISKPLPVTPSVENNTVASSSTLTTPPSSTQNITTKPTYNKVDQYLNNMISRAEGVYEWENNDWKYPDTYQYDFKQSLKTLNDQVKKDLQEYRINVHIGAS
jgi:hypothetical protein